MRVLKLSFVVLNNNSDAFFHSISPMKAFSPEKVYFMIWFLNTFILGHHASWSGAEVMAALLFIRNCTVHKLSPGDRRAPDSQSKWM